MRSLERFAGPNRVNVTTGISEAAYQEIRKIAEREGIGLVDVLRGMIEGGVELDVEIQKARRELEQPETELGRLATKDRLGH